MNSCDMCETDDDEIKLNKHLACVRQTNIYCVLTQADASIQSNFRFLEIFQHFGSANGFEVRIWLYRSIQLPNW